MSTSTNRRALGLIGLGVLLAAAGYPTLQGQQAASLSIKEIGSMHVGGGNVSVTGAAMPQATPAGRGAFARHVAMLQEIIAASGGK